MEALQMWLWSNVKYVKKLVMSKYGSKQKTDAS